MGHNRRVPYPPRDFPTMLELRAAGVPLFVRCPARSCGHMADVDPNSLRVGDHETTETLAHRFTCTACGRRGGMGVSPDPRAWVRYLHATGQQTRVPWYGANIRDKD